MSSLTIALIAVAAAIVFAIVIAIIFLGPMSPFGIKIGSGIAATQQENFTDFTNIAVNSGFNFDIVQSNTYRITVTADDNLLSYIEVTKIGGTLSIGFKPGYSIQSNILRVQVAMPDLQRLELSGGARGTAEGFESSHQFTLTSSGGSRATIQGQAGNLIIDASGGSQLDLSSFHVNNAKVNLSGGTQATVNLDGTLNADLSGGSRLFYTGNPTLGNINTSGGSTLSRR